MNQFQNPNNKLQTIFKFKSFEYLNIVILIFFVIWCLVLGASPVYADHCAQGETHTDLGCVKNDPLGFASDVYGIGLSLIGGVALLSIIYGAFLVLTSQGDPVRLQNGKSYIVYALIGLALAVLGFVFYRVVTANVIKIPGFS